MARDFAVGDKVRLTGKFLRSTGQYAGGDAVSTWTVIAVKSSMVVVDELQTVTEFTAAEINADPTLKFRRIAKGNLQHAGGR